MLGLAKLKRFQHQGGQAPRVRFRPLSRENTLNRPSIDIGPRSNIGVDTGSETARNRACREPTENEIDSQSGACLPPRTTALGNHLPNCLRFAALGLGYVSSVFWHSWTRGDL